MRPHTFGLTVVAIIGTTASLWATTNFRTGPAASPATRRTGTAENSPRQDATQPPQPSERAGQNADNSGLITLPSGSIIPVRLADEVNSHHDKEGALYTGTVDPSVLIQDHVVIPRGTEAHVRLEEVKKGGHVHGKANVRLELISLIINGERLGVETDLPGKSQSAAHAKVSAEMKKGTEGGGGATSGSAGAGTEVGAAGAAVGPVIAAFTAANVDIKPGSRVEFTLESPFTFQPPPTTPQQ